MSESLPCTGPEARHAALVRVAALRRESGQDADRPDSGEHGKVVSVDLIFQGSLADLIQPMKFERHPTPVRVDQAVETHGESGLVLIGYGLSRANDPRTSRHQDALPVCRVKRHRNHGQDRAGKVTGKLRDQRRF